MFTNLATGDVSRYQLAWLEIQKKYASTAGGEYQSGTVWCEVEVRGTQTKMIISYLSSDVSHGGRVRSRSRPKLEHEQASHEFFFAFQTIQRLDHHSGESKSRPPQRIAFPSTKAAGADELPRSSSSHPPISMYGDHQVPPWVGEWTITWLKIGLILPVNHGRLTCGTPRNDILSESKKSLCMTKLVTRSGPRSQIRASSFM